VKKSFIYVYDQDAHQKQGSTVYHTIFANTQNWCLIRVPNI